jgi:MurNAc alpha-1-phosphate uridylyltransferase
MSLTVVILAGGLATRMRPRTNDLPKSLLEVGGRPFADIQLTWLQSLGVRDVVFSVAHLGQAIRDHVGDGSRFGLSVRYVFDGETSLGTAGALRAVIDAGEVPDSFGVINGDSYLSLDLPAVVAAFDQSGLAALMTVMRNRDRWDASNAVYADGRVLLYDKRRPAEWRDRMEWIDYGFAVLRTSAITERVEPGHRADLAEVLRELSAAGRLAGYEVEDRFFEIGSPQGIADLQRHLSDQQRATDPVTRE